MQLAEPSADLLPILAVTSANYAHVFSFWASSLDLLEYPREKRHVVDLGELQPPFGYCTDSWRGAIDRQLLEVAAWIRDHQGEHFLHTDTDIQFFPRFLEVQAEWLRWMREEDLDMIFMRERTKFMPLAREGEVNAGFYIVRCSKRTLRFWEQVLADELEYPKMDGLPPYTDQYHLNQGLRYRRGAFPQEGAFGVRWAAIPDCHCIWSEPESEEEASLAAFHHAVNTQDKPQLLQQVRERVLWAQVLPGEAQAVGRWAADFAERTDSLALGARGLRGSVSAADGPQLARLQQEVRALVDALAGLPNGKEPGDDGRRCAGCQEAADSWVSLRWGAEDGKGYCPTCWRHWYSDGAGPPPADVWDRAPV